MVKSMAFENSFVEKYNKVKYIKVKYIDILYNEMKT